MEVGDENTWFTECLHMKKYAEEYEAGRELDFTRMEYGISKFCKWLIDFYKAN